MKPDPFSTLFSTLTSGIESCPPQGAISVYILKIGVCTVCNQQPTEGDRHILLPRHRKMSQSPMRRQRVAQRMAGRTLGDA
jgi:hypothetical protein